MLAEKTRASRFVVAYRSQCAAPGEDCKEGLLAGVVLGLDHGDHGLENKTRAGMGLEGKLTRHRWGGDLSC